MQRPAAVAAALLLALSAALAHGSEAPGAAALEGACYCRTENRLQCLGVLPERDCARRCTEEFCDDWFWLERRACWNWGYGG
jgi:hypothetical protein